MRRQQHLFTRMNVREFGIVSPYLQRDFSAAIVYPHGMSDLLGRITLRAEQCHGQPCIRGMRIRVIDILEMLAGGMTQAEILADYPYLEPDDIRASLAYAAQEMNHPVVTAAE
jgi:uncharacterized protein (DUF433 family)